MQEFLDRMDRDVESMRLERTAGAKAGPLLEELSSGYHRFAGGSPSKLEVSPVIRGELLDALEAGGRIVTGVLLFKGCPVVEALGLEGFRWV